MDVETLCSYQEQGQDLERHSQHRITENPVLTEVDAIREFWVSTVVPELLLALAEILHDVELIMVHFPQVIAGAKGEGLAGHPSLLNPAASFQHSYQS